MDNQQFEHLKDFHQNKKIFFPILVFVLCLLFLALTASLIVDINNKIKEGRYIGQDIASQNTITVSATSEVYTKPDLAITTFSVITEKESVDDALNANSEKMNKVIEFIKAQGVAEKDLKTTGLNIYPRYEWYKTQTQQTEIYSSEGKRYLVGYEVNQTLQVKIRDMEKVGTIIQGAVEAGANEVGSLIFTIDNEDEFKNQAREQAIDEAKEKARDLASQLGVKLVKIKNFYESSYAPYYPAMETADAYGKGGGAEAPQIETGENKIEVTVSITYEIN